jgi:DNA replication protein DnaC
MNGSYSVVRCLCPAGARKRASRRIDEMVPADVIRSMWPNGAPSADGVLFERLRKAGVPEGCLTWSLATYKSDLLKPTLAARGSEWIAKPRDKRPDVVLFGPNGTGKSGLALAMLRACVERGETGLYTDAKVVWMRWNATFAHRDEDGETEHDMLDIFSVFDVLVLDELTKTPTTDKQQEFFRVLLDARQKNNRPTILVLNIPSDTEAAGVPDLMTAAFGASVYDRLRERASMWSLSGPSQRRTLGATPRT